MSAQFWMIKKKIVLCGYITEFLCNALPVTDGGAVPDGFQNPAAEPGARHFHKLTLRQEWKKKCNHFLKWWVESVFTSLYVPELHLEPEPECTFTIEGLE